MNAAAAIHEHLSARLRARGERPSYRAVGELLGEAGNAWHRWCSGATSPSEEKVRGWADVQGLRVYTTPEGWACEDA